MACKYCGRESCSSMEIDTPPNAGEIESVGYRPKDNLSRWSWMEREIERDGLKNPLCLEIGSNFGFMSLNLAKSFPASRIFSIEGSYGTGNNDGSPAESSPGIKKHTEIRSEFGLKNNTICVGLADNSLYEKIIAAGLVFDYQISLSVFHWTVDATKEKIDSRTIFSNLLRMARTTFIELPAMDQGKPLPGIYRDYVTIPEAMQQAAAQNGLNVRITYLGSCKWYGTRDTYRIDNLSCGFSGQRPDCESVVSIIGMPTA